MNTIELSIDVSTWTHSKQFLRSVSWLPAQSGDKLPIWLYTESWIGEDTMYLSE